MTPRAVEVGAVGRARSCCWRRARPRRPSPWCDACASSSTSIDSTSSSSPASTSTPGAAAARAAERRHARSPTRARTPAAQPRGHHLLLQPRASQTRLARDEPERELQRVGHDLAQPPTRTLTTGTRRPAAWRHRRVDDRAGDRQLVQDQAAVGGVGAQLLEGLEDELQRPADRAPTAGESPRPTRRPREGSQA